jgi:Xaa-Pro aminopeptidase
MRYPKFNPDFFSQNRKAISEMIGYQSIAVVYANELMPRNGDQFYSFRQNSDLFYLTGLEQENIILLLIPGHTDQTKQSIVFIERPDHKKEKWIGKMLSEDDVYSVSCISTVHFLEEFESLLPLYLNGIDTIYINTNEYPKFYSPVKCLQHRRTLFIKETFPLYNFKRLQPLMIKKRLVKQACEIDSIKQSIQITENAFSRVLKSIRPGLYEYQLEAEIIHQFIMNGASGHAYPPIIACGENALCLHYNLNNKICKEGELVLLDFGAEFANYSSDCSRTIPVNGNFSIRQKQVYEAVLDVLKRASLLFIPGESINSINAMVAIMIQDKLIELNLLTHKDVRDQNPTNPAYMKYYYHGVSHFMGLDVHDPGGKDVILEEGMVVTCEPGIYIPEEAMGIRLENDILVAPKPVNLMKNIPIEVEEIENIINQSKT